LVDDRGEIFASFKPQGTTEERSKPQPGLKRLRHYAKFGGEFVRITKEDLAEMRYQANGRRDEAGLTLLGFRPVDSIPFYHNMGPAYLIYPNDDDLVKGSRAAFQALHASMLRKQVLALGEVLFRVQWSSKLVAIYPLEEEVSEEDGQQKRPPGMMVITLPFEDDMRELEPDAATKELLVSNDLGNIKKEEDQQPDDVPSMDMDDPDGVGAGNVASQSLVDAAVNLIGCQRLQGMTLGEDFTNAALDDFFNYLEAVALELPAPSEEAEYDTRPDDDTILGVVRDQIEAFRQHLPEDAVAKPKKAARKRKIVPDDTGLDWEELYRSDALDSCKVDQLKSFLRSKGGSTTGKKAVLVQAVAGCLRADLEKRTGQGKVKMEV
jgi:ATP-dependent DNA helicase 2 subunit 1